MQDVPRDAEVPRGGGARGLVGYALADPPEHVVWVRQDTRMVDGLGGEVRCSEENR
jgi:hypothetical protein